MPENTELTALEANETTQTTAQAMDENITAEDIADVIAEFEAYRERLVNNTMETAQRAKLSKAKALAQLESELVKIDAALEQLRTQQAALTGK